MRFRFRDEDGEWVTVTESEPKTPLQIAVEFTASGVIVLTIVRVVTWVFPAVDPFHFIETLQSFLSTMSLGG